VEISLPWAFPTTRCRLNINSPHTGFTDSFGFLIFLGLAASFLGV
jgi:hypothetical protein